MADGRGARKVTEKLRFTKAEQDRFMDRITVLRCNALALYASPRIPHLYATRIYRLLKEWERRWSPRETI